MPEIILPQALAYVEEEEEEEEEEEKKNSNSNSKTLFYKDCSLGSFKNLSNN